MENNNMENMTKIESKFSNEFNAYYGHGTGLNDPQIVESIFKNGLRCSHEQLDFTTITFGVGSSTLLKENEEKMNNWQHKDSKQIIIASLPLEYHLLEIMGTPLYGKRQAAFYDYISQEQSDKLGISPGLYLKPEFIMGVYDANKKDFISNERYYENLSEAEQEKLMDEIKKQYINILKESGFTFSEYAELLKISNMKNPLTEDEIKECDKEVFDSQMLEKQLTQIAGNAKSSDFNETANAILSDAQKEQIEDYVEEEWLVDDEW